MVLMRFNTTQMIRLGQLGTVYRPHLVFEKICIQHEDHPTLCSTRLDKNVVSNRMAAPKNIETSRNVFPGCYKWCFLLNFQVSSLKCIYESMTGANYVMFADGKWSIKFDYLRLCWDFPRLCSFTSGYYSHITSYYDLHIPLCPHNMFG